VNYPFKKQKMYFALIYSSDTIFKFDNEHPKLNIKAGCASPRVHCLTKLL